LVKRPLWRVDAATGEPSIALHSSGK